MHKKDRFVFNLVRFTNRADSVNPYNLITLPVSILSLWLLILKNTDIGR